MRTVAVCTLALVTIEGVACRVRSPYLHPPLDKPCAEFGTDRVRRLYYCRECYANEAERRRPCRIHVGNQVPSHVTRHTANACAGLMGQLQCHTGLLVIQGHCTAALSRKYRLVLPWSSLHVPDIDMKTTNSR